MQVTGTQAVAVAVHRGALRGVAPGRCGMGDHRHIRARAVNGADAWVANVAAMQRWMWER